MSIVSTSKLRLLANKKIIFYPDGMMRIKQQDISIIGMNEIVIEKFHAIEVMTKMIGRPEPRGMFYAESSLSLLKRHVPKEVPVTLFGGFESTISRAPFYLWGSRYGEDYIELVLECEKDFTLQYPINFYLFTPKDFNKVDVVHSLLHSEIELVNVLSEILSRM